MRTVALIQGIYYFITGIWPLISINTFQAVTGPKADLWLVKTVGVLISIIGIVLVAAGLQGSVTFDIFVLATAAALGLTAIDVNYSLRGVISRIYLLDACAEVAILLLWLRGWLAGS